MRFKSKKLDFLIFIEKITIFINPDYSCSASYCTYRNTIRSVRKNFILLYGNSLPQLGFRSKG